MKYIHTLTFTDCHLPFHHSYPFSPLLLLPPHVSLGVLPLLLSHGVQPRQSKLTHALICPNHQVYSFLELNEWFHLNFLSISFLILPLQFTPILLRHISKACTLLFFPFPSSLSLMCKLIQVQNMSCIVPFW